MRTPNTPIEVVSVNDPAINVAASNLEEYARTRDLQNIKFVEGVEPDRFWIKRLTVEQMAFLESTTNTVVRLTWVIKEGLDRVVFTDGTELSFPPQPITGTANDINNWSKTVAENMEVLNDNVGYKTIKELYELILQHSSLGAREKKAYRYIPGQTLSR